MFRKTISLITLAALMLNMMGITGCTDLVRLPMGEVDLDPPKTITRLKLKTGGYVRWETGGPSYFDKTKLFDGLAMTGDRQYVRLASIDSVYFVVGNSSVERALKAEAFHKAVTKKERNSVRGKIEGLVCDTGQIIFEKNTAYIDTTNHAVIGTTKQGEAVNVPLDKVQTLNVRRSAPGETALMILGVGSVAFLIGVGIALSGESYGFGGGGGTY